MEWLEAAVVVAAVAVVLSTAHVLRCVLLNVVVLVRPAYKLGILQSVLVHVETPATPDLLVQMNRLHLVDLCYKVSVATVLAPTAVARVVVLADLKLVTVVVVLVVVRTLVPPLALLGVALK